KPKINANKLPIPIISLLVLLYYIIGRGFCKYYYYFISFTFFNKYIYFILEASNSYMAWSTNSGSDTDWKYFSLSFHSLWALLNDSIISSSSDFSSALNLLAIIFAISNIFLPLFSK